MIRIVVVMGVAGSGKTTVGKALAHRLGWQFIDADDLHSAGSVARMRAGEGLDENDRSPWLERVRARIDDVLQANGTAVVAFSGLRQVHRDQIVGGCGRVLPVFLLASPELVATRLAARQGHYAGPSLVASQFAALEPARGVTVLDAAEPVDSTVDALVRQVHSGRTQSPRASRCDAPKR